MLVSVPHPPLFPLSLPRSPREALARSAQAYLSAEWHGSSVDSLPFRHFERLFKPYALA